MGNRFRAANDLFVKGKKEEAQTSYLKCLNSADLQIRLRKVWNNIIGK